MQTCKEFIRNVIFRRIRKSYIIFRKHSVWNTLINFFFLWNEKRTAGEKTCAPVRKRRPTYTDISVLGMESVLNALSRRHNPPRSLQSVDVYPGKSIRNWVTFRYRHGNGRRNPDARVLRPSRSSISLVSSRLFFLKLLTTPEERFFLRLNYVCSVLRHVRFVRVEVKARRKNYS